MQYRKFGKHDFKVSALGFGCMRLPFLDEDDSKINEEEAINLIRYAIDNGVNYLDTAYPYHKGNSELLVGKALKDGYREKVKLATKCPVWLVKNHEDFNKYLNEQLEKLQTDHIDMYLLHALSKERWEDLKKLNVFKFLEEAVQSGKVKYVGFSFHDELPVFKEIVNSYNWDFCQIQYNYMDTDYQAGKEGLKLAASKGMAVIIMEPLKGGKLAKNPPQEVQSLWNTAEVKRSAADWALRWIWNHKEVTLLLSGMGAFDQVVENIKIADNSISDSLNKEELELVDKVKEKYNELIKVNCTACNYCMPCPFGVNIPRNFALLNESSMYNDINGYSHAYNNFMAENDRANHCKECGLCETKCPQNLPIRQHLKEVHAALGCI
ncbi:aldo/keto reductase [Clostridium sp. YIM B02515]|uniref:Aldo/keto reductase n=1 Tax=Clostridium rhizosphaerae TaxID=2803861 RepID=A0ABS1T7Z5_9CLOT|nr:aldo/keto reductase [Clostridium rhizosphaerae]MBL4935247.1 aldo/keto reductase [Clostridium rhizosphaerae]